MSVFAALAVVFSLVSQPAQAGVTVTVWSPGVAVFDPYDPGYAPGPRVDYVWIPGSFDPYGYFVPGYWQPVAPNPGYVWAMGYWSGRTYHEGYWRPASRPGEAWIDGYYVQGRYVTPRWVRADQADHARAQAQERVAAQPRPAPSRTATPEPSRARSAPEKAPASKPKGRKDDKKKH